jgi:hypothetical protein
MKYPHALLGLLLAVRAVTAASAPLPDLLPPNARVMFGIQLRNLVSSSLVQGMTDDLRTASSEWMKLIPLIGFDPFHDIDEVLVASTGDGQKAPMLLVASGRFGAARFSGGKPYHGVSVVDGGKGSNGVMALLAAYSWPGNVRELRNVIERATVLSSTGWIERGDLPAEIAEACPPGAFLDSPSSGGGNLLESTEKRLLVEALAAENGNVSKAARRLGVSRNTMRYRMQKFGLQD